MKKIFFLVAVLLAPVVYAADDVCTGKGLCEDLPACERLGYTKNRYCPEGYITCPFDSSYIWCKIYECAMGGYLNADSEEVALKKTQGYLCNEVKFHGLNCVECDAFDSKCQYDDVNKGDGILQGQVCGNGKYPKCESNCAAKDKTAEILAIVGAIPVRSICTACGADEVISTDFTCAESYVKDKEQNTCVPVPCPDGYTKGLRGCSGKPHPQGWRYEENGVSGGEICGRCVPHDCPVGSSLGVTTCLNDVGYLYIANGYSGDTPCGFCESLRCIDPYTEAVQSINDCPTLDNLAWSADKAWVFEHSVQQAGDKLCGLCTAQECENTEYNKKIQSLKDCPNQLGYVFKYDTAHFYGNRYCGKCEKKACPEGSKTDLKLQECVAEYHDSSFGTKMVATGDYSGGTRCQACACDASVCAWNGSNIGAGGQGVDVCCDGSSYYRCERKESCQGDEVADIENAKVVDECMACGHTYKKVTECKDGYKIDDNKCVKKTCADWELKASSAECANGFMAVVSSEHPGCYSCEVKTCADWGEERGHVWYDSSQSCAEGYEKTVHNVNVGGEIVECFDCDACTQKDNYITVKTEDDIGSYVIVQEKFKSCDEYQYCAGNCLDGWVKDGCKCVAVSCNEDYVLVEGLKQSSGDIWTDQKSSSLKYELCETAGQKRYKWLGCMNGYSDVSCDASIGEFKIGTTKNGYNCYQCGCSVADVADCKWTASNMGDGKGTTPCCDGTTYKGCELDTTKCNYTLTEKPQNADTVETCTACNKHYYRVTKCKEGYAGDSCSSCDTAHGYIKLSGACYLDPHCENGGSAVLSSSGDVVCSCATGYTGEKCNACDEDKGYGSCGGQCRQKLNCAHGEAKCVNSTWTCECSDCYKGSKCDICDDGCKDFGDGCVLDNDCSGHGVFNGTTCECNHCYKGDTCSELDEELCTDGQVKTCESEGYSNSCNLRCQSCEEKTVETVSGTLECFDVKDKVCPDFCGKFDISSSQVTVENDTIKCKAIRDPNKLYQVDNAIYAWLNDEAKGSTVSMSNGCDRTCYFDDANCSEGERLTDAEKTEREGQGYVCSLSGYTPAGSKCYNCLSNQCPEGLFKESEIGEQEANEFVCTEKTNVTTMSGQKCYECLNNRCNEGYVRSGELFVNGCNKTAYQLDDDFTSRTDTDATEAGYCCYKLEGSPRACMAVTDNVRHEKPANCISTISNMRDYGASPLDTLYGKKAGDYYSSAPVAACHQCVELGEQEGDQRTLRWYAACRTTAEGATRDYSEPLVDAGSGLPYQNGSNCCFEARDDDGNETYEAKNIMISSQYLGYESTNNAQTCYWTLNKRCEKALVDIGFCVGERCNEKTCSLAEYPYYEDGEGDNKISTIPVHARVSGKKCTPIAEDCSVGVDYYSDFTCDAETHVKNSAGTACECNDNSNGKGYYREQSDCEKATYYVYNCYKDEGQSDCYVKGGCNNQKGYYDEDKEADCLEAVQDMHHSCVFDEYTGCFRDGGCDENENYYQYRTDCENAIDNQGHLCTLIDNSCYFRSGCNINGGYYDFENECPDGLVCALDEIVTDCYVATGCDLTKGYYDDMLVCLKENAGHDCKQKIIQTGNQNMTCFEAKEACDTVEGYYDDDETEGADFVYDSGSKCYMVKDCSEGWADINSDDAVYFTFSQETEELHVKAEEAVKNLTCGRVSGCAEGYVTENNCQASWTQKAALGSYACGTCE